MGHQRNRRRERRRSQHGGDGRSALADAGDRYFAGLFFEPAEIAARFTAPSCGSCREFLEEDNTGRGECLHPGSGFLLPWTATPACAFYARRRGRAGPA